MGTPALTELLAPEFVADRADLSLSEIRERRSQCQSAEEVLSLQRRMVQGRLDILQAEMSRRAGDQSGAAGDLLTELPAILVDHERIPGAHGRLTTVGGNGAENDEQFDFIISVLNSIVSPAQLASLETLSPQQLESAADEIAKLERSISKNRRQLHTNIDALQEEIVRRYKTGDADVQQLLDDNV